MLLFAGARDLVGAPEVRLPWTPGMTVQTLLSALGQAFPTLVPYLPSVRVAVNGTYAHGHEAVSPTDELAVIPPVAGG
ncbi:MAG: MoaD/ThiS family protein [Deltaproteobacteria bacterium]|nr:MoaD/ThiS family protein [Deltaproteobacteria bacterium]